MGIKSIYYGFEDAYYGILDKIDGAGIPIYKVIDPIDQILPSFIFIIISVILFGVLLLIGIMSAVQGTATFIVEDENGDPLPDILVTLSDGEQEEIKTTDAFGEFQTSFFGENIKIEVDENDFEEYIEEFNVQAGGTYTIRLESKGLGLIAKTIRFQVRDETQALLDSSVNVTMTFSCSGNASPPSSFSRTGGSQQVTAQTNCGTLTTTINVTGYKEKRKSINVATQEGIVLINLEKDELFAKVRVLVKDEDTSEVISGVSLKVKKNGVTFINGGTTDSTGTKVISNVPVGTYIIEAIPQADSGYVNGFSQPFNVTANNAKSNIPVEVEISLRKPVQTKKILLKFVDKDTDDPIQNVEAQLVVTDIYTLKKFSDSDGIVEYINMDEDLNYAVIASHVDYLLKVTEDLPVIESSSNETETIELEHVEILPAPNSGDARLIVTDFAGDPVPNASTRLYDIGLDFPIGIGLTGSDGITNFINLPLGDYNAHAEKTINSILYEDDSQNKSLVAGETTDFLLSLVISEGTLEVEVIDESTGEPVAGAIARFIDYITGEELANEITDADGKTVEVSFQANRVPYAHVESAGFYDFITAPYNIFPNDTQTIIVELVREEEFNSFDIELVDILNDRGNSTPTIKDNEQYTFKFNLLVAQQSNDVEAVIRTGLEQNIFSEDSVIVVRSADSIGSAVFSDCYQANDYADCSPDDVTIDAKQVIIDLGDLDTGVYELLVTTFVKEVPDGDEDDTTIEVRYGAKTEVGGSIIYRQSESVLYLWSENMNDGFCFQEDCGAAFLLEIQDEAQILLPTPIELEAGQLLDQPLGKDVTYLLRFETFNLSEDLFEEVELAVSNDNAALAIPAGPIEIGRFAPGANVPGSFTFATSTDTASTSLDLNLNLRTTGESLGITGDSINVLFAVSGFNQMSISLSPTELEPDIAPQIISIRVVDGEGAGVPDVDIRISEQLTGTEIVGGSTNSLGFYLATFNESYVSGVAFDITAEKTGFDTVTTTLEVGGLTELSLQVVPDSLVANQANNLTITVKDDQDQPLQGATVRILDSYNSDAQVGSALQTDSDGVAVVNIDSDTIGDARNNAFEVVATEPGFGTRSVQLDVIEDFGPIDFSCITIDDAPVDDAQFRIAANGISQDFFMKNNGCVTPTGDPPKMQITTLNNNALTMQIEDVPYNFGDFFTLDDGQTVKVTATSTSEIGNHPLFIFGFVGDTPPDTGGYPFQACLASDLGDVVCELEQGACSPGRVGVVSLSGATNASVGPYKGEGSYDTKVCCDIGGSEQHCTLGLNTGNPDTRFITISRETNAHASSDTTYYPYIIYCEAATSNSCGSGTPVLNLSAQRNAHVQLGDQLPDEDRVFAGTAHVDVFDASVCFGGGNPGNTGETAAPRVLYNWNPAVIDENTCSADNPDYVVCDSAQFMLSLLKRLDLANEAAIDRDTPRLNTLMAPFDVYLMRDSFSDDFRTDFDEYMIIFFGGTNYENSWDGYFADTNLSIVQNATHQPGIYTVTISVDFTIETTENTGFFDRFGDPKGTIELDIGSRQLIEENLLYYLPFNGRLGHIPASDPSRTHREGYGVGFTGESGIPIFFDPPDNVFGLSTENMTEDSTPISIVDVEQLDTFEEVQKDPNSGKVFSVIETIADSYKMTFAPATPNPVIIKAEGNGANISATYTINENGEFVNTEDWITRLKEIVFQDETGAFICTDPDTGNSLPPLGTITDEKLSTWLEDREDICSTINIGIEDVTYGFNRESDKLENIFFETIFYTPKGNTVIISNECQSQGRFYVANLTNEGDVSTSDPFEVIGPGQNKQFNDPQGLLLGTVADLVLTVGSEDTCIVEGETPGGRPNSIALWWNEDKLLQDLRDAVETRAGIAVNTCMTND